MAILRSFIRARTGTTRLFTSARRVDAHPGHAPANLGRPPATRRCAPGATIFTALLAGASFGLLTGCAVKVQQDKPLVVNINVSGRLDLVIHDARNDLQEITGKQPTQTVSPEDIGLPESPATQSQAPARERSSGRRDARRQPANPGIARPALADAKNAAGAEVMMLDVVSNASAGSGGALAEVGAPGDPEAAQGTLKTRMRGRLKDVRAMLDAHVAGESHTGLLAARGALTAAQKATLDAENADRSALYAAEAKAKATTVAEVGLAQYIARLEYAKKGDWYEKFNKTTGKWEWHRWKE